MDLEEESVSPRALGEGRPAAEEAGCEEVGRVFYSLARANPERALSSCA